MTNSALQKIGIVGSGRMGQSIFYHLNDFNYALVWVFRSQASKSKAVKKFDKKLRRLNKTGALDDKTYNYKIDNTLITGELEKLNDCDLIIETIIENEEVKKSLFEKLDLIVNNDCLFVSNSSSIKPSLICPGSDRRDKFAGLHFFYPVQFNAIVEITETEDCSAETVDGLKRFTLDIGKQPLMLNEQSAFILNKAFIYVQSQAVAFYKEKILSFKEIDELIRKNIFSMGIFEFFDQVGLDVIASAAKHYIEDMEYKDFISVTVDEIQKLVDKGYLGIKTGRGFYNYTKKEEEDHFDLIPVSANERKKYEEEVVNKLICLYINTVYTFIDKGYCSEQEIEAALEEYKGMEKGAAALGSEIGFDKVYNWLVQYYDQTGEKIYYPSSSLRKKLG